MPITARTKEAFDRVTIPFGPLASTDFGCRVFRDNVEDETWLNETLVLARSTSFQLLNTWNDSQRRVFLLPNFNSAFKLRLYCLNSIPIYGVTKYNPGFEKLFPSLHQVLSDNLFVRCINQTRQMTILHLKFFEMEITLSARHLG